MHYRKQQNHLEQKSRLTKQAQKNMTINVQMAMMSHLSDAQTIMRCDPLEANVHINFVKRLMLKYDNTDVYVEEEILDEIWEQEYDRLMNPETL